MDKLVFDVETKNTFGQVGGEGSIHKLDISFVGAYSYNRGEYLSFFEDDLPRLGSLLQKTGLLIGFSSNRFDIPVLSKYFPFNIKRIQSFDLLEELELATGRRISLDELAKVNLGVGKTGHGLDAIKLFREGRLEELKAYCLNDVRITKDLYEKAGRNGFLLIPDRWSGTMKRVAFSVPAVVFPATLF